MYLEGVAGDGGAHTVGIGWDGGVLDNTDGVLPVCGDWDAVMGELGRQFREVTDVWWSVLPKADHVRATWGALERLRMASSKERRLWRIVGTATREWA